MKLSKGKQTLLTDVIKLCENSKKKKKIPIYYEKILSNYKKLMINAKFRTTKVPIFQTQNIENDRKKKIVVTCTFQSAHLIR